MQSIVVNDNSTLMRNGEMLANQIGAEAVMMDMTKGRYFGMNKTGSHIWRQLDQAKTFDELCEQLATDYKITKARCKEDIRPFITELISEGILITV